MATLLLSGTQLEPQAPSVPLNKPFLIAISAIYLIAMHVFIPNVGNYGLSFPFNATTWIATSLAISLGLYQLAQYQRLRYSKLTIGLWICCVIMTLPIFYTDVDWLRSAGRLSGLWAGFTLFLVLQQFRFSNKHKQRLLWFIVLATLIEALIGFYQYWLLTPDNIWGYDTLSNRPSGIFQQPNVMASFLATGLVLSGYLLARQPKKYNKKLSEVSLLYITPLLSLSLLVALGSLVGWLSAGLGVLLVLPYLYRFSPQQRFINWVIATFAGIVLGFASLYLHSAHTGSTDKLVFDSPTSYTVPQSIDMLTEKPFTGYGYGRFESQYLLYTARQHQLNSAYPAGVPALEHPHNEMLFWGVEGGLLPVLGITLAAGFVLIRIFSAKQGTRLAMFALLLPITLHSQLEAPFYQSAIHWITFVILLFWIDQRVAKYKIFRFSKLSKSLLQVISLLSPAVTCFYMASALHTNYLLTVFEKTTPRNMEELQSIVNPTIAKDRFDWDIYSTYLQIGLDEQKQEYFQPYIDWSLTTIKDKPRPEFYTNLILAYQGMNDSSRAEQIRAEAEFLFPSMDFSNVQYQMPSNSKADSTFDINNQ